MSARSFYQQLAFISIPTAIAIYFVHRIPILAPHSLFSWISILLFIGLCIFMFYVGRKTALSKNKNDFTNAFLIFLMVKLFSCAILAIAYLKVVEPETKLFVLPFFGLYIIYTTFEVVFLTKLGRLKTT